MFNDVGPKRQAGNVLGGSASPTKERLLEPARPHLGAVSDRGRKCQSNAGKSCELAADQTPHELVNLALIEL